MLGDLISPISNYEYRLKCYPGQPKFRKSGFNPVSNIGEKSTLQSADFFNTTRGTLCAVLPKLEKKDLVVKLKKKKKKKQNHNHAMDPTYTESKP